MKNYMTDKFEHNYYLNLIRQFGTKKYKVVILCAISIEYYENSQVMTYRVDHGNYITGYIGTTECLLYISGIGQLAVQRAIDYLVRFKPDIFIFSGIAGTHNSNYPIGTAVVGGIICERNAMYFPPDNSNGTCGPLDTYHGVELRVNSSTFIDSYIIYGYNYPCQLAKEYGAYIGIDGSSTSYTASESWADFYTYPYQADTADNEGIGFAYACESYKLPFLMIRGISDDALDPSAIGSETQGAKAAAAILQKVVENFDFNFPKTRITINDLSPTSLASQKGYIFNENVVTIAPTVVSS